MVKGYAFLLLRHIICYFYDLFSSSVTDAIYYLLEFTFLGGVCTQTCYLASLIPYIRLVF